MLAWSYPLAVQTVLVRLKRHQWGELGEELEDYRQQLLAMAAPPECPTEASQGGSLFTPLIGVPMEHSLDLAVVWALYGTYMCYQFWPMPEGACSDQQHLTSIKWPKRAHPGALTDAGRERTPWLTSWARATFEQGCLSVLPHLEGAKLYPCLGSTSFRLVALRQIA